jgi:hypothetical protein
MTADGVCTILHIPITFPALPQRALYYKASDIYCLAL